MVNLHVSSQVGFPQISLIFQWCLGMFNGDFTCHFWETIWWILGPISKVHRLLKWSDFYTCTYVYDLCATIKQDQIKAMCVYIWLVVLTILKHISQWEGLCHVLWKTHVPNHQPVYMYIYIYIIDISQIWSTEGFFSQPFFSQIQVLFSWSP